MACGCSTIETPPCGLSVEVCKGWYVALDIVVDSIVSGPSHGTLIEAGSAYIYQHDNLSLDSDTIIYDNGVTECTISITILDTVPEDTQLVTFTASGTCEVGTPTYLWTLPEGVTLHPNDNLYQQTIHVYIPLYDPDNPDAEYVITVDVCCGACNDCCKCETITWHPPICTEECGEDPDCYCDDPCLVYNPLTGNCEPLCPPDLLCCPIDTQLKEADIASVDSISVDCTTVTLDPLNGNLVDITLTLTAETTGLDADELIWTIVNLDICGNSNIGCVIDWRGCGIDNIITVSSGQTKGQISDWVSISWVDGVLSVDMDGDWLDAYQNNIENGAPNVPFNILVTVSALDHCEPIQSNYVISVDVVDFVCETNIVITSDQFMGEDLCKETSNCPELRGDVYVCQECCDDLDCPSGNCVEGVCLCPLDNSVPDPITGLCPCPDPLPLCTNCTPTTTYPILTQIGEDPESCILTFEYFDYETCTCKCQIGYCYQLIIGPDGTVTQTECQICPVCANPAEMWYQVTAEGNILYGVSCPSLCEMCVNNVCVPVVCDTGTIPNPIPGRRPCCIADPCNEFNCDDPNAINYCPEIEIFGCGCNSATTECVSCSTIDCDDQEDCPFGCNCDTDTGKCVHNPCDTYTCEDENDPEYCPQITNCGCDDVLGCIPCDTVPCPNGDECPEGCACDENTETCVHNPCFTALCAPGTPIENYCPVVDGCGCADEACIPCNTVPCPNGDECPYGCTCDDNTNICVQDPCVVLELECGLNVVTATYQFNLLLEVANNGILNVTIDPIATEWLLDTIISGPLSDILEWEINLSPFVDGYIPIDDLNAFLPGTPFNEIPNGLSIDTTLFDYEFIMVRCTILNTDVGGTPISVTYRYQDINTEIADQWKEGLGSICYAMYTIEYNPEIPFDNVVTWYIDTDNDEDIDLTITPTDPEFGTPTVVGSVPGFGVAFAGNEYLIITCPDPSNYTVTADVNSGECLEVTACGMGESCPCTGSRTCNGVTITELNSLEGTTWIVGLDFFDSNGNQFPWKCEPLSLVQGCGGTVNSYNTDCGGLIPIEYATAAQIPGQLCCLNDSADTGTPWEDADPLLNDDWGGPNVQCNNCCCGWAYSGVTITSINGSNIVAEITNYAEAKICFQILLDGASYSIDDECCKYYCVTPPEVECEPMSATYSLECGPYDYQGFTFSFDITNPNNTIDPVYSLEMPNNAICDGSPCDPSTPLPDGCFCQPDIMNPTTGTTVPFIYRIPVPTEYLGVFDPSFEVPYVSGTELTTSMYGMPFPFTLGDTTTVTITDLTNGCQTTVDVSSCPNDNCLCCDVADITLVERYCRQGTTNEQISGYSLFLTSFGETDYNVTITIDNGSGVNTSMEEFVQALGFNPATGLCVSPPCAGVFTNTGNPLNYGQYVMSQYDTITFGAGALIGESESEACDGVQIANVADLNGYTITITYGAVNTICEEEIVIHPTVALDYTVICDPNPYELLITITNFDALETYEVVCGTGCLGATVPATVTTPTFSITGLSGSALVAVKVNLQSDPSNNNTIVILQEEFPASCACELEYVATYDCDKDEINILITGGDSPLNGTYEILGANCASNTAIQFTGPAASISLSTFSCTTAGADPNTYTFIVRYKNNNFCYVVFDLVIDSPCPTVDCLTPPTYIYHCDNGFSFTGVNFGLGDTVTFVDYEGGYFNIEELTPCPGVGCHEGSGILWFQLAGGICNYLLGINNYTVHTITQQVLSFPPPGGTILPYLTCGDTVPPGLPDAVHFHIAGGVAPFLVTSGNALFAPTVISSTDTDVNIAITNPVAGPDTITVTSTASNLVGCDATFNVDYDCVDPCINEPDLLIQCGGCEYQHVYKLVHTALTTFNNVTIDGVPYVAPSPYYLGNGNYDTFVSTILNPAGVNMFYGMLPNSTDAEIFVVLPCCADEATTVTLTRGVVPLSMTYIGLMECQQIKNILENNVEAPHTCCTCFTATKTGTITSLTLTDEIQHSCDGGLNWIVTPMETLITTECIECDGEDIIFQRIVDYNDPCTAQRETYMVEDSRDSSILYRLNIQGYFTIELENYGSLPIPLGTQFNLNWIGLGAGPNYVAVSNCTIHASGSHITTRTQLNTGDKVKFYVRYSNPARVVTTNTVEITCPTLDLFIEPIIITKTL